MTLVDYWVTFMVLDAEALTLEEALHAHPDDRIAGVIREDPNEGTAMVVFQIRAPLPEDVVAENPAYHESHRAYQGLRRNAGLPERDPGVATITPLRELPDEAGAPASRPPASLPHEHLLLQARTVHASARGAPGQYGHTIMTAHAACEVAVARAARRLIAAHANDLQFALDGLVSNRWSLADSRVSRLWDALAGDDIRQTNFWPQYKAHLARRQAVAHEGQSMARSDADQSIAVAQTLCDHVTALAP